MCRYRGRSDSAFIITTETEAGREVALELLAEWVSMPIYIDEDGQVIDEGDEEDM